MHRLKNADHSLRGYLERRTTEQLLTILPDCPGEDYTDLDKDAAEIILGILRKRNLEITALDHIEG